MSDTDALTIVDTAVADVSVRRPPEVVLEEAQKAARALKDVIDKKSRKVTFNGEQYLEYEDWQTVGRFYGVTAKVERADYVEYGDVKGFSARAVALRADGMVISAAEAECLNDEEKWRSRAKYEWREKPGGGGREKVKVSEEPVPLFQLKSMAQTRACAKVLRNVLAWVVVLAGYKPTPAEELARDDEASTTVDGEVVKSVRADGVTRIAAIPPPRTGKNARTGNDWTLYTIVFEDGREGKTFDKKIADEAKELYGRHADLVPRLEQGERGVDLLGFDPPPVAKSKPEPETPLVETILVTRLVKGANGGNDWLIVQGSEREYATDDAKLFETIDAFKQQKTRVVFTYNHVPGKREGSTLRKLTGVTAAAEPSPAA